jgi:RHS repeat-associated protein
VTIAYDANGNLLTDNLSNIYTWDPNWGNPASVNSTNLIYDALGQMIEQQNGLTYTQILYSQLGKTAIMNGQTLLKAFVNLPGGGTAIYNSTGLAYYRHVDWLGSSRLTSTSAQTVVSDLAYAPFGEQYAISGTADPSFTGQDSETASGLYDFTFREYSPSGGRWISPDLGWMAAVDPTNPQTWNRYTYVTNNPLALFDPLGLKPVYVCIEWTITFGSGQSAAPGSSGQDCSWHDDGTSELPNTIPLPPYEGPAWDVVNDGSCVVAVSCTSIKNPLTQGNVHCGVTTGANGHYTRYDGGPVGSGGDSGHAVLSSLKVAVSGTTTYPPPGKIIFDSSVSCGVVSWIGQVAYQINNANAPYTLLPMLIGLTPATSNSAAQAMTSSCTLNVPYPSNAPGAKP